MNRIELVSSSARVTSAKFHKGLVGREVQRPGPIDRTPETPGSGKNLIYYQLHGISQLVFVFVDERQ